LKWQERFDEAEGDRVNLAELCRMLGISRQTGYAWIARYREAGTLGRGCLWRSTGPGRLPAAVLEPSRAIGGIGGISAAVFKLTVLAR